ncbi:MAG: tetratricopeptide repeat protein, partial [Candidatus Edwardsbacteria bacterium]|nr:tetratricopeptide repeat protein [Candidatus Edwardsbacteria bacterium]
MSDYYSRLGVSRDATAEEIAIVYRQLVRQRYQEMGSEANLAELSRAYRTVSSLDMRREYDRMLQTLSGKFVLADPSHPTEAEVSYLAGLEEMEKQDYLTAVMKFTKALQLAPGNAHFHSHLGLALGMFRDRLAEAEQCCKRAINLEPDNPELFYNLGFLYQRHNLSESAQEAFSQAQDALAARQARFREDGPDTIAVAWSENQPVKTYPEPGGAGEPVPAGDLLKELESLESTFDETEPLPRAAVPDQPAPADAGADNLLRELESIEAQVALVETAETAVALPASACGGLESVTPATASLPTPPEQAAIAAAKHVSETVSADDLLRELESIEAQVTLAETASAEPALPAPEEKLQLESVAPATASLPTPPERAAIAAAKHVSESVS